MRQWAKATGIRAKTDRQDARLLARYGAAVQPPTWQPLPQEVEVLGNLLSRLEDLFAMLRQEKNRHHAFSKKPVIAYASGESLDISIAFLEQQIESINEKIKQHFEAHSSLK